MLKKYPNTADLLQTQQAQQAKGWSLAVMQDFIAISTDTEGGQKSQHCT